METEQHRTNKRTGTYGLIQDPKYLYLNPDWGLHIHAINVFFAVNQFVFTISCWIYLFYIKFEPAWVYWIVFVSWFTTALVIFGTLTKNFEYYYPYLAYHGVVVPLNTVACAVVFVRRLMEVDTKTILDTSQVTFAVLLIIGASTLIFNILLLTSYYFIYLGYKYLKYDCDDRRIFVNKHPV
ncbi:unnamed protein product [Bursaphelenchus xylophilus]|uniref:(pine wood nematode) hypothetical protein n=1 Tax=Bursaphelenchus xylophilus TaxID=6326 RepID=A0A1I7RW72_BURXY|nr:unnamed protein product [Bursaphelenchus xylophilus]CAG9095216.1 unnamed protein product [Bursaphelenchus xylophilus]